MPLKRAAIAGLAALGLSGCGLDNDRSVRSASEQRVECAGLDKATPVDGLRVVSEGKNGEVRKIDLVTETPEDRANIQCTGAAYTGRPWSAPNSPEGEYGISVFTDDEHQQELVDRVNESQLNNPVSLDGGESPYSIGISGLTR